MMKALIENPSDTFKKMFTLECIEEVYEKKVALNYTRGIDRMGPSQFNSQKAMLFEIIHRKCLNGTYMFSHFSERLQSRGRDRKPRVISIATIRDRIVLSLLKQYLHEVFPECVNTELPNSYIRKIKNFYKTAAYTDLYFYKVDIKSFYDCIDHNKLIKALSEKIISKPEILLIKRAIKTPTVPVSYKKAALQDNKNSCGVPQGLAVSNILANIYVHECDGEFENNSLLYLRYVDDLLFVVRQENEEPIRSTVDNELQALSLNLNEDKTFWGSIDKGVDYLGYYIKLPIVSIKKATVERFLRSLSALFSAYGNRGTKMYPTEDTNLAHELFISEVNEKITGAISENRRYGWLFYFLETDDLKILHTIDLIIRDKFCKRLKRNPGSVPISEAIKKLSKAYYHARYHLQSGYIHNYDKYDTMPKKLDYLKLWGFIKQDEESTYSEEDIERLFKRARNKRLSDLASDVGEIS